MIQNFADQRTEDVWNGTSNARTRQLQPAVLKAAVRKLDMLAAAHVLDDLRVPPGNRLEQLKGDRAKYHSIRINDQWRIVFRWTPQGPAQVEICDYH